MKRCLFVAVLMLCTASAACAQQAASREQGTSPARDSRTTFRQIYVTGKCSFTMQLNGGSLSIDDQSFIKGAVYSAPGTEEWSFPVKCHTGASQEDIDIFVGAKRVGDQWIWVDGGTPFSPAQRMKITQLTGKNWHGTVVGYDMTTGPEELRQRILTYCFFETHGSQILCGRGPAMGTSSPATTKLIDKVLAVLKTIVFVDVPARSITPPSPPTSD